MTAGFPALPARFALGARARFRVSGRDALRYLNGQLSNDVGKIPEGGALPALLLTAKGKLVSTVLVWREGEAFLIDADFALRESLGPRVEQYVVADDVTVEDISPGEAGWHVVGLDKTPDGALACTRMGIPGFDAAKPPDDLPEWDTDEREFVRIARGVPAWGRELDSNTLPHEARLDATHVDFRKGCYVGQETVSRIQSVGRTNRRMVGLKGPFPPETPAALLAGNARVGELTSAVRHFGLSQTLGLAYVSTRLNDSELEVANSSGQVVGYATIHEFPLA